ncbi:MAG: SDR family NAD(P)-dependent oxidoreductase [Bacteroidota bacterium]
MGKDRKRIVKYFREYSWPEIFAMIKNNRKEPASCKEDFRGKLVVITGASSGIGYATARMYASKGADLLCINRNREKSEALKGEIEKEFQVQCNYLLADLSSLEESHRVAAQLLELQRPIDVLIHNAGIFLTRRELTPDGIEKVFMVNHLSSFIINYRLKNRLLSDNRARIILVSSEGHRFAAWGLRTDDLNFSRHRYSGLKSYGSAKLAQLLSMHYFEEYFRSSGVTINAMHPGAVKTDTGRDNGRIYQWYKKNILDRTLKPVSLSAEALYYLGAARELASVSGSFFNLTTLEEPAPPAKDREVAKELFELSLKMGKLEPYGNE